MKLSNAVAWKVQSSLKVQAARCGRCFSADAAIPSCSDVTVLAKTKSLGFMIRSLAVSQPCLAWQRFDVRAEN